MNAFVKTFAGPSLSFKFGKIGENLFNAKWRESEHDFPFALGILDCFQTKLNFEQVAWKCPLSDFPAIFQLYFSLQSPKHKSVFVNFIFQYIQTMIIAEWKYTQDTKVFKR